MTRDWHAVDGLVQTEDVTQSSRRCREASGDGEDVLPERTAYRDEGCELAPACLACPFPECRYEYDGRRRNFLRESRNEAIRRLRWEEGLSVMEIAARFGISRRSVHRIVRRAG